MASTSLVKYRDTPQFAALKAKFFLLREKEPAIDAIHAWVTWLMSVVKVICPK